MEENSDDDKEFVMKLKKAREEAMERRVTKMKEQQENRRKRQKIKYYEKKKEKENNKENTENNNPAPKNKMLVVRHHIEGNKLEGECTKKETDSIIIIETESAEKKTNSVIMEEAESSEKKTENAIIIEAESTEEKTENIRMKETERMENKTENLHVTKKIRLNKENESKNKTDYKSQKNTMKLTVKLKTSKTKKRKSLSTAEKRAYEREKKRRQRTKIYNDPELHKEFLEQQQKFYQNKKKKGSVIPISKMTKRTQALQRREWNKRQRKCRERKKEETFLIECNTPPQSPSPSTSQLNPQKISGRKRSRKIRDALKKDNKELSEKNEILKKKVEMYRKRAERLHKCKKTPSPSKMVKQVLSKGKVEVRRQLLFSMSLAKQIKYNYKSASEKEKSIICKVVAGKILKKYKVTKCLKGLVSLHRQRKMMNRQYSDQKKGKNVEHLTVLKKDINDFFCDDEITTQAPGKKDFITFKKEKKLKRYLNDTMKNLHTKFIARVPYFIGYSTFCKLKPFFAVHLKVNARDTCACVKHLNMELKLQKLKFLHIIKTDDISEISKSLTCDRQRLDSCMLRRCERCKELNLQAEDFDSDEEIFYYEWNQKLEERVNKKGIKVQFKVQTKEKIFTTKGDLFAITVKNIPQFLVHLHTIHNQYQYLKNLKGTIDDSTAIVNVDFSENYATKFHTEIQSLHFGGSRKQLTLHSGVFYVLEKSKSTETTETTEKEMKCYPFCSVSEDLRHTAVSVFAHLKPILELLKERNIKNVHIFTDGPTGQYRNKSCFFLITHFAKTFGFNTVSWNFWESGHGKGPSDGVGATCKSKADSKVAMGMDISSAQTFITAIQDVNIKVYLITSEDVNRIEELLPASLKAAESTLKIHQVIWQAQNKDELYLRTLSCVHSNFVSLPCTKCDFKPPIYKPLTSFESNKKHILEKTPNQSDNKSICNKSSTDKEDKCKEKSHSDKESISVDDWVAVLFDDTWYPGKVESMKMVGERQLLSVKFLVRSRSWKNKAFHYDEKESVQDIFANEIICKIDPPQATGKSKRSFFVKEFDIIENILDTS